MDNLSAYLHPLVGGLILSGVFSAYRKLSARWSDWKPSSKKLTRYGLGIGVVVGGALVLNELATPERASGAVVLVAAIGFALPTLAQLYRKKGGIAPSELGLVSVGKVVKLLKAQRRASRLDFGGVPIALDDEIAHVLIAGDSATDRQAAVSRFLKLARERGDSVVLLDRDGQYLKTHFDADTDFVFNPLDARCVGWSPVAEMQNVFDAQALARVMVPDHDTEGNRFAQAFITILLRRLWEKERPTIGDFLYFAMRAPRSELEEFVGDIAAPGQLSSDRTIGSVRERLEPYLSAYFQLPVDQPLFSASEMVKAEHSGFLFLPYAPKQIDELAPAFATLLDAALRATTAMPHNYQRRIWFVLDDLADIGKLPALEELVAKPSGAGGALIISTGRVHALDQAYQSTQADSLLHALRTWLLFKPAKEADAERTAALLAGLKAGGAPAAVPAEKISQMGTGMAILRVGPDVPLCAVTVKNAGRAGAGAEPFEPHGRSQVQPTPTVTETKVEDDVVNQRRSRPLMTGGRHLEWSSPVPVELQEPAEPESWEPEPTLPEVVQPAPAVESAPVEAEDTLSAEDVTAAPLTEDLKAEFDAPRAIGRYAEWEPEAAPAPAPESEQAAAQPSVTENAQDTGRMDKSSKKDILALLTRGDAPRAKDRKPAAPQPEGAAKAQQPKAPQAVKEPRERKDPKPRRAPADLPVENVPAAAEPVLPAPVATPDPSELVAPIEVVEPLPQAVLAPVEAEVLPEETQATLEQPPAATEDAGNSPAEAASKSEPVEPASPAESKERAVPEKPVQAKKPQQPREARPAKRNGADSRAPDKKGRNPGRMSASDLRDLLK